MDSKALIYSNALKRLFPFYFTVDLQTKIVEFGPSLAKVVPNIKQGISLRDVVRPLSSNDLELLEGTSKPERTLCLLRSLDTDLILRGEFTPLDAGIHFFAGSPWIQDSADLNRLNLGMNDFSIHDPVLDLLNVIQSERMAKSEIHGLVRRLKAQQASLKQANETLEKQNSTILATQEELKLKEAEASKLAHVASRTDNAVIITDAKGQIEWVNAGFERLTHYSLDEVIGMNPGQFLQGSQSQPDQIAYMREKLAKAESFKTELINYTKSGEEYWVAIEVQPIFNKEHQLTNFIGISTDITRQRESQKRLRLAKQKAEEANRSKSEFLSRMSHELRTPMNGILGFGQLLKLSPLQPRQYQNVDRILKAGNHLLDLINEVLDLSKVEAGALNLSLEPVRIIHVIDETLELTQSLAKEKAVTISVDASFPKDLNVKADRKRIKQVLLNLVSNAIKYNVKDGTVLLKAKPMADKVWSIQVTDTGLGIPEDQMGHVFVPFERMGAANSDIEGTGLGLALSQKLVQAMNGKIGLHANKPQGCVFWLEFEQAESTEQIHSNKSSANENQSLEPKKGFQGSILYIEDNMENLQLVEQVMESRPNVRLLSTIYGMEGIRIAKDELPDLIILDLHLPDCHGREVLQQLKQTETTQNIPVLVLSADAMNATVDEMLELGADHYLTKPLNILSFLDTWDQHLPKETS